MLSSLRTSLKNNRVILNQIMVVSVSSILAAFFSYYYNFMVQSKIPDLTMFSNFQLLITLLSLMSVIPATVSTSISTTVGELNNESSKDLLTDFFLKLTFIFFVFGIVGFLLLLGFSPFLSSIFKIEYPFYFTYFAIIFISSIVITPITSFLFGLLKFYSYSVILISMGILKIVFLYFFFSFSQSFNSIFYSFIFSYLLCIIIGLLLLKKSLTFRIKNKVSQALLKKVFLLSGPILFILMGKDLISQLDFMIVKSKFDLLTSGQYALLLNLGKIFLFGSLIIIGAMLPQIANSFQKGEDIFKKFKFYLILESVIIVTGLVFFVFFPSKIVDFLIIVSGMVGLNPSSFSSYYTVVHYLPWYGTFIALVVIINFLSIFLISIQQVKVFIPFILAILTQSLFIHFVTWDIYSVIICNIIMSVILAGYLVYEVRKKYQSFNHSSSL